MHRATEGDRDLMLGIDYKHRNLGGREDCYGVYSDQEKGVPCDEVSLRRAS